MILTDQFIWLKVKPDLDPWQKSDGPVKKRLVSLVRWLFLFPSICILSWPCVVYGTLIQDLFVYMRALTEHVLAGNRELT